MSCDPRAIEVVIHNLIDNGIKYGHRDQRVDVALRSEDEHGLWTFSVTDLGEPIPEDDAVGIYEFFRRSSDPRVTRRRSGMGLGLAICREILDAHFSGNELGFTQVQPNEQARPTEVTFSFKLPMLGKGAQVERNYEHQVHSYYTH